MTCQGHQVISRSPKRNSCPTRLPFLLPSTGLMQKPGVTDLPLIPGMLLVLSSGSPPSQEPLRAEQTQTAGHHLQKPQTC